MPLNSNNFLPFDGGWTQKPYTIVTGLLPTADLFSNVESVTIDLTSVVTFSNGIDLNSFKLISIKSETFPFPEIEMSRESYYDGALLTVYRPVDLSVLAFKILFTYADVMGNTATGLYQVVDVSPIIVAWEAYPASASCVLDNFGNNNGYLAWGQLRLYNTGSGFPISPLQLKPNISSDPDYIAPQTDLITCPLVYGTGNYAPLIISNFSKNGADSNPDNFITITAIVLACSACGAGGTPITLNIPCSIAPGQTQRFNVPAGAWDTGLTLTFTVNPGGNMVTASPQRRWYSQLNGAVDDFPTGAPSYVINTSPFGNHAITVPFPNGITIFCE